MTTPIVFLITDAGRQAALDALNTGLTLRLSHIAVGRGQYVANATQTALMTEFARFPLAGGDVQAASATLRFSAQLESATNESAFEVGLFSDMGVLFAVSSTTGVEPLIYLAANVTIVPTMGLALDVPTGAISVVLDPNAPLAIAMLNDHLAAVNPHPQYAMLAALNALQSDLNQLKAQTLPKVGDVKYTSVAMSAAQFTAAQGFGIWEVYAAGRVIVGAGQTTDTRSEELQFEAGDTGGEFKHVQTIEELAGHKHGLNISGDANNVVGANANNSVSGTDSQATLLQSGDPSSKGIELTGESAPFNIMQPYIVASAFVCVSV